MAQRVGRAGADVHGRLPRRALRRAGVRAGGRRALRHRARGAASSSRTRPSCCRDWSAALDEPLGDEAALPTYLVCELARRHVTVALTGDGGDEAFAGYERYAAHASRRGPAASRRWLGRARARSARRRQAAASRARPRSAPRASSRRRPPRPRALRAADGGLPAGAAEGARRAGVDAGAAPESCSARRGEPGIRGLQLLDVETYLPGDLLLKADLASMAHSLELRSPLLDHEVLELGLALPDHLKQRGRTGKVALRRAFADDLPPEVAARGKTGFGVPIGRWFREELARARARRAARRDRARPRLAAPRRGRAAARRARARRRPRAPALVPAHARALAARARRRAASPRKSGSTGPDPLQRVPRRGRRGVAAAPRRAARRARRHPSAFIEKSDDFARTFVESGTYGFIPGEPSAYTQPLYGFFLMPIYWVVGRIWVASASRRSSSRSRPRCSSTSSGGASSRRASAGRGARRDAAPVPRLARRAREPRDPRPGCSRRRRARHARRGRAPDGRLRARSPARSPGWRSSATCASLFVPLLLAAFLRSVARRLPAVVLAVVAALVVRPGWFATRSRSAASRSRPTRARSGRRTTSTPTRCCARGGWIDDVPRIPGARSTPEEAGALYRDDRASRSASTSARRCASTGARARLLARAPGREGEARAARGADVWQPRVTRTEGRAGAGTWLDTARDWVEPLYALPLFAFALAGLRSCRAATSRSRSSLLAYKTLAAMVFAARRATACRGTSCSPCPRPRHSFALRDRVRRPTAT